VYSFQSFARKLGFLSCSAAFFRRRATISLSLPGLYVGAVAPLPPPLLADMLVLRRERVTPPPTAALLLMEFEGDVATAAPLSPTDPPSDLLSTGCDDD